MVLQAEHIRHMFHLLVFFFFFQFFIFVIINFWQNTGLPLTKQTTCAPTPPVMTIAINSICTLILNFMVTDGRLIICFVYLLKNFWVFARGIYNVQDEISLALKWGKHCIPQGFLLWHLWSEFFIKQIHFSDFVWWVEADCFGTHVTMLVVLKLLLFSPPPPPPPIILLLLG